MPGVSCSTCLVSLVSGTAGVLFNSTDGSLGCSTIGDLGITGVSSETFGGILSMYRLPPLPPPVAVGAGAATGKLMRVWPVHVTPLSTELMIVQFMTTESVKDDEVIVEEVILDLIEDPPCQVVWFTVVLIIRVIWEILD